MEKITELTQVQFDEFENAEGQEEVAKALLGLPSCTQIGIGDTAVKISNSKPLEVYKNHWKGADHYYIVIEVLDGETAMTYSIYTK